MRRTIFTGASSLVELSPVDMVMVIRIDDGNTSMSATLPIAEVYRMSLELSEWALMKMAKQYADFQREREYGHRTPLGESLTPRQHLGEGDTP